MELVKKIYRKLDNMNKTKPFKYIYEIGAIAGNIALKYYNKDNNDINKLSDITRETILKLSDIYHNKKFILQSNTKPEKPKYIVNIDNNLLYTIIASSYATLKFKFENNIENLYYIIEKIVYNILYYIKNQDINNIDTLCYISNHIIHNIYTKISQIQAVPVPLPVPVPPAYNLSSNNIFPYNLLIFNDPLLDNIINQVSDLGRNIANQVTNVVLKTIGRDNIENSPINDNIKIDNLIKTYISTTQDQINFNDISLNQNFIEMIKSINNDENINIEITEINNRIYPNTFNFNINKLNLTTWLFNLQGFNNLNNNFQIESHNFNHPFLNDGFINLQLGLIISILKQITFEANKLYNTEITADVLTKLKKYLQAYLDVVNIYYYFEQFCKNPYYRLFNRLKEEIEKYNKNNHELEISDEYLNRIEKCTYYIIEQKQIRTKQISYITLEIGSLFYKSIEKSKIVEELYKDATNVYNQFLIVDKCQKLLINDKIRETNNNYKKVQILDLKDISNNCKIIDPSYILTLNKYKNLELDFEKKEKYFVTIR